MTEITLQDCVTDHLFLLVGGNPLPNYAAAKLLCRSGEHIVLIYTEGTSGTERYAKKLAELLNISWSACIGIADESDAFLVRKAIEEAKPHKLTGSVGLNYTGGTKVMAIHAYQTIKAVCPDVVCSYLDPRQMALRVEMPSNSETAATFPVNTPKMRAATRISFLDLLSLHGLQPHPSSPPRQNALLPDVAKLILGHFVGSTDEEMKQRRKPWNTWKATYKQNESFADCLYADIRQELDHKGISNAQGLMAHYNTRARHEQDRIWARNTNKEKDEAIRWIDKATWLEDVVLDAVKSISKDIDFNNILLGVETDERDRHFEVDVVAMRGYQVFVFACTTQFTDSACKEKLFEVALRTSQIGGDEARFALVCFHLDGTKIQGDIGELLTANKFKIFDIHALSDLPNQIKSWVLMVDREVSS
jgi:hypothetical protein